MVAIPYWVAGLVALTSLLLLVILWSVKRRRRPRLDFQSDAEMATLVPSIVGLTQGTLTEGNQIELIQNGAFFERLFRDLEAAKNTINFETFLTKKGELTHRITEILSKKAGEGVEVRMMLDGTGGKHFGHKDLKTLRESGVHARKYHPVRFSNLGVLNNRDHRKLVVIDGRIGYIGGHCLVDSWLGDAQDKQHFRDISARVEGPVVRQLQSAFAENWIEETGEVVGGLQYFPELEPRGESKAHAVWLAPQGSPSTLKLLHYMAIQAARKSITIQNPYFLPDPDARKALLDAAARGVKVRVMIPATEASDSPLVQHASHHHYGTLLKGGVQLFDYQRTLLHQKVIVVDSCWAALGSTNFDDRSFEVNDEISLAIHDDDIALELEAIFERDLADAKPVDLREWKRRPWGHKLIDFCAFLFNEQL